MTRNISLKKQLNRLILSCGLAAVMFANGYSLQGAKADDLMDQQDIKNGVIIVPASALMTEATDSSVEDFKRGQVVPMVLEKTAGTIIVDTHKNVLLYVLGNGKAVQFPVATAKPGFEWSGSHKVSSKVVWPDWRPPVEMRKRRPELPQYMAGGPKNPLGARAIYLGSSIYRIHGTNEPKSIGKAASSGCIRMLNADVEELYRHVKLGATVIVI